MAEYKWVKKQNNTAKSDSNMVSTSKPNRKKRSSRNNDRSKRFHCKVCKRSMAMSNKAAHLKGKSHRRHKHQTQSRRNNKQTANFKYKNHSRKKRTKNIKSSIFDYDLQEELAYLAMEIDTQWGMLPPGQQAYWGSD